MGIFSSSPRTQSTESLSTTPNTELVYAGSVYVERYKFCKYLKYIRFFFGAATVICMFFKIFIFYKIYFC